MVKNKTVEDVKENEKTSPEKKKKKPVSKKRTRKPKVNKEDIECFLGAKYCKPRTIKARTRLSENMTVASWDCGIRNLSYCLMEYHGPDKEKEFTILYWEVIDLACSEMSQAIRALNFELERRPWVLHVDYVCIEQQVKKNESMKYLSHVLQMYFVCHASDFKIIENSNTRQMFEGRPRNYFVPARTKLTVEQPDEDFEFKGSEKKTKQLAIHLATKILKAYPDPVPLKYLNSFSKKDDLCDSFLQGLVFLRKKNKMAEHFSSFAEYLEIEDNKAHVEIFSNKATKNELGYRKVYRATSWPETWERIKGPITNTLKVIPRINYTRKEE